MSPRAQQQNTTPAYVCNGFYTQLADHRNTHFPDKITIKTKKKVIFVQSQHIRCIFFFFFVHTTKTKQKTFIVLCLLATTTHTGLQVIVLCPPATPIYQISNNLHIYNKIHIEQVPHTHKQQRKTQMNKRADVSSHNHRLYALFHTFNCSLECVYTPIHS